MKNQEVEVPSGSLETRIRLLEDREEIKELTAKYALYVATCNITALVDLFDDDGRFHASPHKIIGKAELLDYLEGRLQRGGRIPTVQNHIIVLEGDVAQGSSVMLALWGPDGPICGAYRDTYRRTPAGWRFVDRFWAAYADPTASES